jgi:hypothetical protein
LSNLIFPTIPSQGWSVFKIPNWNTITQTSASGKEVRAGLWANPTWDWKLTWEILKDGNGPPSDVRTFLDWFTARRGGFDSFLFTDPTDNTLTGQLLGYGNGTQTQFQLARSFIVGGGLEAIQNPNAVAAVYLNAVSQAAFTYAIGTENLLLWSEDFTNGVWTSGGTLTITGNTAAAPDGTTTADKLARLGSSGTYAAAQVVKNLVAVGDVVTFSTYLIQGTAGVKGQLRVLFLDAAGNILQDNVQAAVTLTGSWQRFSYTLTVPPGTVQVQCNIQLNTTSSVGDFITAWGTQLERFPSASGFLATTSSILQPNGVITFGAAPAAGVAVTADFSYYFRVRFKNDLQEFENFMSNLWSAKIVELRSVKL